jgi:hypothetical protein
MVIVMVAGNPFPVWVGTGVSLRLYLYKEADEQSYKEMNMVSF